MRNKRRETLLKIGVGVVAGLFLLDRVVISPAMAGWKAQGERLTTLRKEVQRGRQLIEREQSLRGRWEEMQRTDMPDDVSIAENDVFQAISRWTLDSHVNFTNLMPQWRAGEEGCETFECRATAVGDQATLGRLLYEIETDPLPAHVEECELAARDAKGTQLTMTMRFSFVRLVEGGKKGR
jgi:hypothetical protein